MQEGSNKKIKASNKISPPEIRIQNVGPSVMSRDIDVNNPPPSITRNTGKIARENIHPVFFFLNSKTDPAIVKKRIIQVLNCSEIAVLLNES